MWFFQFFHHKRHGRSCWVHCIMGKKCSVHSIQCDVLYHAHFDTCSAGGHLGILCIENLLTVHRIYSNRSTVVCYSKHYYFVIAVVLKLHTYLELSWNIRNWFYFYNMTYFKVNAYNKGKKHIDWTLKSARMSHLVWGKGLKNKFFK